MAKSKGKWTPPTVFDDLKRGVLDVKLEHTDRGG